MKIVKKKMIWMGIIAVAGIALFVVTMSQRVSSSTSIAFASALTAISIAKLIQLRRISKNPQLLRKYEIGQKEERFIAIAEKSGRFTFILTVVVEFVSIFVLILMDQNMIATIISTILGIQTLVYLIIYYNLCKKY